MAAPLKASCGFQVAAVAIPAGSEGGAFARLLARLRGDADPGVGQPLRRDAEAFDALDVAGRLHQGPGGRLLALEFGAELAEHHADLLVEGHLAHQLGRAFLRGVGGGLRALDGASGGEGNGPAGVRQSMLHILVSLCRCWFFTAVSRYHQAA